MSQLELSQGLAQLDSAWLIPKAHKLAYFQNHIKFIITKISERDNFANIAPNLMILLPLDSSHQEESNGSQTNFVSNKYFGVHDISDGDIVKEISGGGDIVRKQTESANKRLIIIVIMKIKAQYISNIPWIALTYFLTNVYLSQLFYYQQ
ncbi:hypothetical protein RhiirA4_481315 [Rhizophagus irregularis]|uniref:Uncharacterized protein n=1 Tax=Rhizophagus irregularis TaxID=588596 RepID=A0A2I1HJ97_9GLOM|nr:hypothetical protein RhiirA4_481315 [Rhizophagus irregularis]